MTIGKNDFTKSFNLFDNRSYTITYIYNIYIWRKTTTLCERKDSSQLQVSTKNITKYRLLSMIIKYNIGKIIIGYLH